MKVEIKYEIGDSVKFRTNGKIAKGKVSGIKVDISRLDDVNVTITKIYYNVESTQGTSHKLREYEVHDFRYH